MTSKNEYKCAETIEPEMAKLLDNGIMKVETPTLSVSHLNDKDHTRLYQIWCHSPRVINNSIGICNHSLGAIFANVNGHANVSMLVECPKCRTAYVMNVELGGENEVEVKSARVTNINRSVLPFVDVNLDAQKNTWIVLHKKNS